MLPQLLLLSMRNSSLMEIAIFLRCCFCCIVVVFRYPIAWRCIPKKSGESFFLLLVIVMMTTTWRFSILCLKCSNLIAVWLRLPGWLAGWLATTMLVFRRTNIVSINVRGHQHSHFHHLQFHSFIHFSQQQIDDTRRCSPWNKYLQRSIVDYGGAAPIIASVRKREFE